MEGHGLHAGSINSMANTTIHGMDGHDARQLLSLQTTFVWGQHEAFNTGEEQQGMHRVQRHLQSPTQRKRRHVGHGGAVRQGRKAIHPCPRPNHTINHTIRTTNTTGNTPPSPISSQMQKNRSSTHEARRDLRPPPIDLPLCGLDVISLAPWNSPSEKKSLVRVVTRFGLTRAVGRG